MKIIEYSDGETVLEGKFFRNSESKQEQPCVLVAHAWDGPNEHFDKIAEDFCFKGIHSFAIDIYGKGVRGKVDGDNSHLMNPLLENRGLLHKRLLASLETVKEIDGVDSKSIYALGFCFGGLCVLDLARLAPEGLKKVVAVHSILDTPLSPTLESEIKAEVLLLNGYEDPVVKPEKLLAFFNEMTDKKACWRAHIYGKTKHAFTFKGANLPELGIEYNEQSSDDAFRSMEHFLIGNCDY